MINNSVTRLIKVANSKKPEKYNILTFPTHERYESQLCKTGHNFYSFRVPDVKRWNSDQTPVPENYYILPEQKPCEYIEYDFILSQSKFWQFQVASQLAQQLNIPVVSLEHTVPTPNVIEPQHIKLMQSMVGDVNVFISDYSKREWGINYNSVVIHHGLDTDTFKPLNKERSNTILTVANDFVNRDYCLNYSGWQRVTKDLETRLVGDTKGLSESAASLEDLVNEYNLCGIYFNSSTLSPIPTSLLEAMSCGCPVVSTATCMIPDIIKNGENGFISNDENELRSYIELLLSDKDLASKIGNNARQTILDRFPESKFIESWNTLFDKVYEVSSI